MVISVQASIEGRAVRAVLQPGTPSRRQSVSLLRYDRLAPGAAKPVRIHVLPDGWRWVDPAGSRCSVQVDAPPKGESAEAYGKSMHQAHADVLKAAAELDPVTDRAEPARDDRETWMRAAARAGLSAMAIDDIAAQPMRPAPRREGGKGRPDPHVTDPPWAPPPRRPR